MSNVSSDDGMEDGELVGIENNSKGRNSGLAGLSASRCNARMKAMTSSQSSGHVGFLPGAAGTTLPLTPRLIIPCRLS